MGKVCDICNNRIPRHGFEAIAVGILKGNIGTTGVSTWEPVEVDLCKDCFQRLYDYAVKKREP